MHHQVEDIITKANRVKSVIGNFSTNEEAEEQLWTKEEEAILIRFSKNANVIITMAMAIEAAVEMPTYIASYLHRPTLTRMLQECRIACTDMHKDFMEFCNEHPRIDS